MSLRDAFIVKEGISQNGGEGLGGHGDGFEIQNQGVTRRNPGEGPKASGGRSQLRTFDASDYDGKHGEPGLKDEGKWSRGIAGLAAAASMVGAAHADEPKSPAPCAGESGMCSVQSQEDTPELRVAKAADIEAMHAAGFNPDGTPFVAPVKKVLSKVAHKKAGKVSQMHEVFMGMPDAQSVETQDTHVGSQENGGMIGRESDLKETTDAEYAQHDAEALAAMCHNEEDVEPFAREIEELCVTLGEFCDFAMKKKIPGGSDIYIARELINRARSK